MRTAEQLRPAGSIARLTPETAMDTICLEDMRRLVFNAAGNIERLALLAGELVDRDGIEDLLPQLMQRLLECNSVILSASGGDTSTLGEGYQAVFGRFGPGFEAILPDRAEATSCAIEQQAPFAAGVKLAVSLLREAATHNEQDTASAVRWYRQGRPQVRFARAYLDALVQAPELIDGFAAVLSSVLSDDQPNRADEIEALSLAEYEPGTPGEDGTYAEEAA